ncbi:hypothetical protein MRAB57_5102, partial [Mycobacterium rhizamassiliense]
VAEDTQYFDRGEMEVVHTMFRREFGHLPRLIREAVDAERIRIVADHFTLIADALHHHHRAEDELVWPLLKKRAGDCVEKRVQMMQAQHHELEFDLEWLCTGIRNWATNDPTLASLEPASEASRFVELLNEHMAAEEQLVVPLMEQHITAAEWDAMVERGAAASDPAALPLNLGMLLYEGDAEVVQRVLDRLPADLRDTVCGDAADSYAQYAQRVHGTTTPARSAEL